ncbi:S-layer homology domain-containing protein [Heliobacterium chlorum]|uniref:S-layer homology domain-containing protein n=1 Tax=Heliobacterium chlorum TaxID=2698 RepID=A0ABR7T7S2_HELCL|nr:S-layer homology domain-containing protein [Heliobacterium chlorum]MBC9786157.1 S-layer homology domain-containing protein [Heliobacterium chlorum]
MGTTKKFFAVLLLALFTSSLTVPSFTSAQTEQIRPLSQYDIRDIEGHWAESTLQNFVYSDALSGYIGDNGVITIQPNHPITRAELVTFLVRTMGLQSDLPGETYRDVPANQWYAEPIRIASALGVVSGVGDGLFQPNRLIQRDEIAALVIKAFEKSVNFSGEPKHFSDVSAYWATPYIDKASSAGLIGGYGNGQFKPYATATRAEAFTMVSNALNREFTSLPSDQRLTDVVLNQEKDSLTMLQRKDFSRVSELTSKYCTGFYSSFVQAASAVFEQMDANGYSFDVIPSGQPIATIVRKTDRFAAVQLKERYDLIVRKDGEQERETRNSTSLMLLKKMPGEDSWKIYMAVPQEETAGVP